MVLIITDKLFKIPGTEMFVRVQVPLWAPNDNNRKGLNQTKPLISKRLFRSIIITTCQILCDVEAKRLILLAHFTLVGLTSRNDLHTSVFSK